MPDVVYGFSVDDNLVDVGLRRQEQKFQASAGRIDRAFEQAGASFQKSMFGAQQLARAASVGFAASAAIVTRWTREYAEENKSAADALDRVSAAGKNFRFEIVRSWVGDGSALRDLEKAVELLTKGYRVVTRMPLGPPGTGLIGVGLSQMGPSDYWDLLDGTAQIDVSGRRAANDTERMIAARAAVRQAGAGSRESRWWTMRQNGQEFQADMEAAIARSDDAFATLRDEVRAGKRDGKPMDDAVVAARRQSIADVYEMDVRKARAAREDRETAAGKAADEQRRREANDAERLAREASGRDDEEFRALMANKSGRVELDAMRVGVLRLQGREREAEALEAEVDLQTTLLELEQNRLLTADLRMALEGQAAEVYAARITAMVDASRAVAGGRGVDAGIASAAGVVRGSLIATARDNPAALQRRSNELLERIARAVEDGTSATFAP